MVFITLDDGNMVETAMHPVIVSESRATDIPTFYAERFFYRLRKGYSAWINPFDNKKRYVSYLGMSPFISNISKEGTTSYGYED